MRLSTVNPLVSPDVGATLHGGAFVSAGAGWQLLDSAGSAMQQRVFGPRVPAPQVLFPGGTTLFLRADGSFAAPTATAADPSYSPGSFTVATETWRLQGNHVKLTTTQRITLAGTGRLRVSN